MADRPAGPAPFVGRAEELVALGDAFHAARLGALVTVLIAGDSGIGKTRLAREFTERLQTEGVPVHWGRCVEVDGAPPFWPWAQVLRSLGGPTDAEMLEALDEQGSDRFAAFDALAQVLRTAGDRPRIIVLDDLHVADLPTLELLRFLTRAVADIPLLVIGTHRAHELRRDLAREAVISDVARVGRRLEPRALSRDEVSALMALSGVEDADPGVVDEILTRSGGNALFVDELVQAVAEGGPRALAVIPAGAR
ncbi:MAG: Transcriptional regulator, ATPase, winged helix family, partial [Acidimicrobiales bacterium]|nr:Transcriptional regulator, ATPase, winged helix family [Acidimicrobiales bacterium]